MRDAPMLTGAGNWLLGGGAMGALIRTHDWAGTPFGVLRDWPHDLRTSLRIVLNAHLPMSIWWGKELRHLYNDAYARVMLGRRHPWSLGRPAAEVWQENWDEFGARAEQVLRTGEPAAGEMFRLTLDRNGFREDAYHTLSFSPVPGRGREVAGLLCCATEETRRVLDQRREQALHALSDRAYTAQTAAEAYCVSAAALAQFPDDLPFLLLYGCDPSGGRVSILAGAVHVVEGTAGSPRTVDLDDPAAAWPLRRARDTRRGVLVGALPEGLKLRQSRWPEPVRQALVLPIISARAVVGFAVAGLSPRQTFDAGYREFLESMAAQLATAIGNAHAFEEERRRADMLAHIEARHRANEQHLRLALDVGPIGTWEWDPETATVTSDAAHQSLYGLPPHDGPRPEELYRARLLPEEIAAGYERARTALRNNTEIQQEHRVIRPDGEVRWVLSLGRPKLGNPTRMIGVSFDVTERRRMEDVLRRSEARLRAAVDLLGLGLYDWDPRTNAVRWDARVKAMWGLPADAHVDYDVWRAHVHPDDLDRVEAAIQKCADPAGEGIYDIEYRVIGADGIERWVATRGHTSFGTDGPVAFTGVALDISERKRAEERLLESEARLSAILAQLPVGVGLVDRRGRFVLRGGLLGRLWDELMPLADRRESEKWRAFDGEGRLLAPEFYPGPRALRGETVVPGIDFIHTSDVGHETWIRVAAVPFRNSKGDIEGAVAILDDVDSEKRAEQAIRESEQRFRQFAEHSSHVIWIFGVAERQLEYLSPAYEDIWGQSRQLGEGYWLETIHPDDHDQAVAALDRVVLGELVVRDYRIVRPDGAMRSIRDTLFPMRDRDGRVQRVGGISQDVTVHSGSLVYLVDADERSRTQLHRLLVRAGYSVKPFASGAEFLAVAPVLALGCVVVDIRSPAAGGLAVPRQLKANGSPFPVLMAGASGGDVTVPVQAMKAGAVDWIEMPCEPDVLLGAVASALAEIRTTAQQNREASLAQSRIASLSMRERQVLDGLLGGGTNKTIARGLGISPRTVELHRAKVMEKLGVQNFTQAVLLTAAAGIRPNSRGTDQ
jgi:PAS domain S-box-containing protein